MAKKKSYHKGNTSIPGPSIEREYTTEQVREITKCRTDLRYFAETYFYIVDPDTGRQTIKLYDFQKRMLDSLNHNRRVIFLASRQIGKTTLLTIFALWVACFNRDQNIVLVANKENTAAELLRRIRFAYELLPEWLKPGVKNYARQSIEFEDNVRIAISTTTGSAGRGQSVNCVTGDGVITLRNKKTGEVFKTQIKDAFQKLEADNVKVNVSVCDHDIENVDCFSNVKYDILTEKGFKSFRGILQGNNTNKIQFTFSNNEKLTTTPCHKFLTNNGSVVLAKDISASTILFNNIKTQTKAHIISDEKVYEILHVEDTHTYYVNDILSHQCLIVDEIAHMDSRLMDEFWTAVYPTISRSKKSKVLVSSTPNGTGNLFHRLVEGANAGTNGFAIENVTWRDVPDRDEAWKAQEIMALGSYEKFLQEYENFFAASGESSLDHETFMNMKQNVKAPVYTSDEDMYKVFEFPQEGRQYAAGVDTAEGIGKDYSVIQVIDFTDPKDIRQVATYACNTISPAAFANKVYEIFQHWGMPWALIERNGPGAQIVDRLMTDFAYQNIVSYGLKLARRGSVVHGMISHTNTKYKCVTNMRHYVNNCMSVKINDIPTLEEFLDFIRFPNGSWKARSGKHDDRVMALCWALMILDKEIMSKYFDIVREDDFGKPAEFIAQDYGVTPFLSESSLYVKKENNETGVDHITLPCVMGMDDPIGQEMAEYLNSGWTPADQYQSHTRYGYK